MDQRRILKFFVPLAVSWIFMSLEGPIASGFISRRAGEEAGLAGMALLMSLAILIESPVINLLTTSTTLSRTHASYLQLRKFTAYLMLWVTAVQAIVTITPVFWWLAEDVIGAPHEVAVVLRPAMAIMIPWAAFVGWRRFHQGVLIRFDNTRPVGVGTTVRVISMFLIGAALFALTDLPGLTLASWALVGSVFTECAFIHFAARVVIRRNLDPFVGTEHDTGTTMRALRAFHFPLTAATVTTILAMPLVTAALARSPDSRVNLAAWGLSMSVVFLFRSLTFALPETIIALYCDERSRAELAKFCGRVGIVCSAAVVVAVASGGAGLLFARVLDSTPQVAAAAVLALILSFPVPAVNARASLMRGLLAAHNSTRPQLYAIVASVTALAATLAVGLAIQANGMVVVGIGMFIQIVTETAVLSAFWRRSTSELGAIA